MLSDEKWESAEIREIVDSVLEPYASKDSTRIRISGPEIRLAPGVAVMMSMVLHELATNAAKYGALADGAGKILVKWIPIDGGKLRLTWSEIDGPAVQLADRKGFGSKLIEEAFAEQVGGSAVLEYKADGLVCILECPHL